MKTFKVTFICESNSLLEILFEKPMSSVIKGDTVNISDTDAKIILDEGTTGESFGLYEYVSLIVTFSATVSAPLIANWFKKKLSKTNDEIIIKINDSVIYYKDLEKVIEKVMAMQEIINASEKEK